MQYDRDHPRGRPSLSAASRWQPPKGRTTTPRPAAAGARSTGEGGLHDAGGAGGGKVHMNHQQRRRRNDRNGKLYRKQRVVTPDGPSAASSAAPPAPKNDDPDIPRLDPNDPVHAKRIRTRRRQVLFGKNTAGYEEYVKKVPRHRRRIRSPDCPMTPDHTLDIPAKRWQGLMNAWRRGLHKYDPPDLHLRRPAQDKITLAPRPCVTEEDRKQEEVAMAKAAGLQVAFGSMNVGGTGAGMFSLNVGEEEGATMAGANNDDVKERAGEEAQFEEEAAYRRANEDVGFLEGGCEEDSDDDIL